MKDYSLDMMNRYYWAKLAEPKTIPQMSIRENEVDEN
jgi:hypothetical protein